MKLSDSSANSPTEFLCSFNPDTHKTNPDQLNMLATGFNIPQDEVCDEILTRMQFLSPRKENRRQKVHDVDVEPAESQNVRRMLFDTSPATSRRHSFESDFSCETPTTVEANRCEKMLQAMKEREEEIRADAEATQAWLENDLIAFNNKVIQLQEEKREILEENLLLEDNAADLYVKLKTAEKNQIDLCKEIAALKEENNYLKSQQLVPSSNLERIWDDSRWIALAASTTATFGAWMTLEYTSEVWNDDRFRELVSCAVEDRKEASSSTTLYVY